MVMKSSNHKTTIHSKGPTRWWYTCTCIPNAKSTTYLDPTTVNVACAKHKKTGKW